MKTNFSNIQFNEKSHRYFYEGQELTSVTKYLKQFQEPFDREGNAERMANKPGETRTARQIMAAWDEKGRRSREMGTQVHRYIESVLTGRTSPDDPFLKMNDRLPEMDSFDAVWAKIKTFNQARRVEWIVGDANLGLAGTIDCVLASAETERYHLWDWKTGQLTTTNPWQNLLAPFDDLDASKLNIYSLQLSLYRLILERNMPHHTLGDSYLVHLTADGYEIHKATDLREPLAAHFKQVLRQVVKKERKDELT